MLIARDSPFEHGKFVITPGKHILPLIPIASCTLYRVCRYFFITPHSSLTVPAANEFIGWVQSINSISKWIKLNASLFTLRLICCSSSMELYSAQNRLIYSIVMSMSRYVPLKNTTNRDLMEGKKRIESTKPIPFGVYSGYIQNIRMQPYNRPNAYWNIWRWDSRSNPQPLFHSWHYDTHTNALANTSTTNTHHTPPIHSKINCNAVHCIDIFLCVAFVRQ